MQRKLDLFYDRLVIGNDLNALAYCYINDCPTVFLRNQLPYKHDENNSWSTDIKLWYKLALYLSTYKFMPFGDRIASIRLEEDNYLKAVSKQGVVCNIKYNHLVISDDYMVEGLPTIIGKTNPYNWVVDTFKLVYNKIIPKETVFDNDTFVNKILFDHSKQWCVQTKNKYLCL